MQHATFIKEHICQNSRKKNSFIIWDEASMDHRNTFKSVHRSLKNIMRFNDANSNEKQFENMRIKDSTSFTEWVLALGDGKLPTVSLEGEKDSCWIKISDDLLILDSDDPVASVVSSTYQDLIYRYTDPDYLRNRGILTLTNQTADEINSYILNVILGDTTTYLSFDSICKASGKVFDQDMMFPV
ncbi:hypothetical protein Dsin_012477 [Dipteronia sinensis]|uniref:ATP-dependent DNA helicase n=1 Tax=Dipteronia sinensis TaxID=43782 RepID=A0AAE0AI54_9ROSI|nr:hypothetical protein Dsin_012477 [Dipteronia sinensis]